MSAKTAGSGERMATLDVSLLGRGYKVACREGRAGRAQGCRGVPRITGARDSRQQQQVKLRRAHRGDGRLEPRARFSARAPADYRLSPHSRAGGARKHSVRPAT